ncbi:MAG TPA: ComEA family DNA-binding protein [Usitatibacter sp.]|nr:ComEA family DNA-binding protein [Usitatibacter sp.]
MKRIAWLVAVLLAYVGVAFGAVNINSATQEQLESLNGVGPVKAKAIIDYRNKHGRFKTLEEIKDVDGIGDATFAKIRGDIQLTGTTVVPKDKVVEKKETVRETAAATKASAKDKAIDKKEAVKEKAADAKGAVKEKAADTPKEKADAKKEAAKSKADAKKEAAKEKADARKEAAAKKKKEDDEKKK